MTPKNKIAKILTKKFFERPALKVARELLGKFLCRKTSLGRPPAGRAGRTSKCFMITEVEAYDGFKDKASHAHRGKTARNAPMFGEAGRWYVYFTYGMHWMLNIVTGPKDYPAAVLIRSIRGPTSVGFKRSDLNGPAKLTKFLKIDKRFNNKPASRVAGLWVAAPSGRASLRNFGAGRFKIQRATRVGVGYAGEWAKKKYRFILKES